MSIRHWHEPNEAPSPPDPNRGLGGPKLMATTGASDVVVHLDGVTIGYDKNKPLAEIPSLKINLSLIHI